MVLVSVTASAESISQFGIGFGIRPKPKLWFRSYNIMLLWHVKCKRDIWAKLYNLLNRTGLAVINVNFQLNLKYKLDFLKVGMFPVLTELFSAVLFWVLTITSFWSGTFVS